MRFVCRLIALCAMLLPGGGNSDLFGIKPQPEALEALARDLVPVPH